MKPSLFSVLNCFCPVLQKSQFPASLSALDEGCKYIFFDERQVFTSAYGSYDYSADTFQAAFPIAAAAAGGKAGSSSNDLTVSKPFLPGLSEMQRVNLAFY